MGATKFREPEVGNVPSVTVEEVAEYSETVETLIATESYVEESPVFEDILPRTSRKPVLPPAPVVPVPTNRC